MAEQRITRIYVLRDPRDGAVRYVGKTVQTLGMRLKSHITVGKRRVTYRDCWIFSLLQLGLAPRIEQIELVEDGWAERERFWILHYRHLGADLTNLTDGGDGVPGLPPDVRETIRLKLVENAKSEDWRAAQAQRTKASMTPERLKEMSILQAAAMTPERRARHSETLKITTSCPEWRARQSAAVSATMTSVRRAEIARGTSASMTAERRKQISETQRRVAADPTYKANQVAAQKAARQRPGVAEKITAALRAAWTPEKRAAAAARAKARHAMKATGKSDEQEPPIVFVPADLEQSAGASSGKS